MERIEAIFGSMGFDVADGPEIETDWMSFTALNNPENHPARSMQDTFYVDMKDAEGRWLNLRPHTSPMQVRYARAHASEVRGHEPDARDPRHRAGPHLPRRQRRDALADVPPVRRPVDRRERQLQGPEGRCSPTSAAASSRPTDLQLRFRPSYFPFTEPSRPRSTSRSHRGPLKGQWLEVAGSGQVHPNVVRNFGLDPERYIGFAFGMGSDRLAMLRYGVNDLRLFFDGDLRFLSQFK